MAGTWDYAVGTVTIEETFAAWAFAQQLAAPLNTREANADPRDPVSLPVTQFYAAEVNDFGFGFDSFTIDVRAAATDCDFAIETVKTLNRFVPIREESIGSPLTMPRCLNSHG